MTFAYLFVTVNFVVYARKQFKQYKSPLCFDVIPLSNENNLVTAR